MPKKEPTVQWRMTESLRNGTKRTILKKSDRSIEGRSIIEVEDILRTNDIEDGVRCGLRNATKTSELLVMRGWNGQSWWSQSSGQVLATSKASSSDKASSPEVLSPFTASIDVLEVSTEASLESVEIREFLNRLGTALSLMMSSCLRSNLFNTFVFNNSDWSHFNDIL